MGAREKLAQLWNGRSSLGQASRLTHSWTDPLLLVHVRMRFHSRCWGVFGAFLVTARKTDSARGNRGFQDGVLIQVSSVRRVNVVAACGLTASSYTRDTKRYENGTNATHQRVHSHAEEERVNTQ